MLATDLAPDAGFPSPDLPGPGVRPGDIQMSAPGSIALMEGPMDFVAPLGPVDIMDLGFTFTLGSNMTLFAFACAEAPGLDPCPDAAATREALEAALAVVPLPPAAALLLPASVVLLAYRRRRATAGRKRGRRD